MMHRLERWLRSVPLLCKYYVSILRDILQYPRRGGGTNFFAFPASTWVSNRRCSTKICGMPVQECPALGTVPSTKSLAPAPNIPKSSGHSNLATDGPGKVPEGRVQAQGKPPLRPSPPPAARPPPRTHLPHRIDPSVLGESRTVPPRPAGLVGHSLAVTWYMEWLRGVGSGYENTYTYTCVCMRTWNFQVRVFASKSD